MAVPARDRKLHSMTIFNEALKLISNILSITRNEKVVPKRHYRVCGEPLVQTVREMYQLLMYANDRRLTDQKQAEERRIFQDKAHDALIRLSGDININIFFLRKSIRPYATIIKHISYLKRLLRAWQNSDAKRLAEYEGANPNLEAGAEIIEELPAIDDANLDPIGSLKEAFDSLIAAGMPLTEAEKKIVEDECRKQQEQEFDISQL